VLNWTRIVASEAAFSRTRSRIALNGTLGAAHVQHTQLASRVSQRRTYHLERDTSRREREVQLSPQARLTQRRAPAAAHGVQQQPLVHRQQGEREPDELGEINRTGDLASGVDI
jgi:hypothetical protein